MDDVLRMGGSHAVSHFRCEPNGLRPGERVARNEAIERRAFEKLGHRVDHALVAPDVVEGEDVRMRQRRHGPRFALEAREHPRICGPAIAHDLDRDIAPEPCVAGSVHVAHAPGAEGLADDVRTKSSAGVEGHAVSWVVRRLASSSGAGVDRRPMRWSLARKARAV